MQTEPDACYFCWTAFLTAARSGKPNVFRWTTSPDALRTMYVGTPVTRKRRTRSPPTASWTSTRSTAALPSSSLCNPSTKGSAARHWLQVFEKNSMNTARPPA